MTDIIIPIHPEWCEKIATGQKRIEIRKSSPKAPFKAYIYMTEKGVGKGNSLYCRAFPSANHRLECGKIIGEYVCRTVAEFYDDDEYPWEHYNIPDHVRVQTCLTEEEITKYGDGKKLFGQYISDLGIYDKPKELSDFGLSRAPQSWCYVKEPLCTNLR